MDLRSSNLNINITYHTALLWFSDNTIAAFSQTYSAHHCDFDIIVLLTKAFENLWPNYAWIEYDLHTASGLDETYLAVSQLACWDIWVIAVVFVLQAITVESIDELCYLHCADCDPTKLKQFRL